MDTFDMAVLPGKRELPSHGHLEDGVTVAPQFQKLNRPVDKPISDNRMNRC